MDVGYKLKIIRLQNNLKQQHIADVLGITRSAYCSYEIGRRAVDLDTLVKISKFYNLPVDVFLKMNWIMLLCRTTVMKMILKQNFFLNFHAKRLI
ncbi:MAG: helix-turn-helix transcriptional regulator [Clostridia bacterium]|nr:helix-turn-helix transcriptional regulator [Clostridia bacterium]